MSKELRNRTCWAAASLALLLTSAERGMAGPIYDNATDFSASNSSSVWSYGQLSAGPTPNSSTFAAYTTTGSSGGIDFIGAGTIGPPDVSHNPSNSVTNFVTIVYQPQQASFHPGVNGEYSVYRFITPTAGAYNLSAVFTGIDTGSTDNNGGSPLGTTTDVHVLVNGVAVFNDMITALNDTKSFNMNSLSLSQGETIDFVVGFGSNGNFYNDSTGLDATISAVPEPTTLTLFGIAAAGLTARTWHRSRSRRKNGA